MPTKSDSTATPPPVVPERDKPIVSELRSASDREILAVVEKTHPKVAKLLRARGIGPFSLWGAMILQAAGIHPDSLMYAQASVVAPATAPSDRRGEMHLGHGPEAESPSGEMKHGEKKTEAQKPVEDMEKGDEKVEKKDEPKKETEKK